MTALYITLGVIAAIVLIIYILLRISVRAYVNASSDSLSLSVKYLWLELYKLEKKFKSDEANPALSFIDLNEQSTDSTSNNDTGASKTKVKIMDKPKKESVDASDKTSDETSDDELMGESKDENPKKGVKQILDEYMPYLPVAKKALKKLLKLIRFYDFELKLTVGDEDAYKAAMKFGKINALVYSALALLCCAFTVNIKHTEINCDFESSKTQASLATVIKVRPSAVLALAIYLGINYLKLRHNQKKKEKLLNKEKENSNVREEQ